MTLDLLKVGKTSKIVKVLDSPYKDRLIALGFYNGNDVKTILVSPLNDPMLVEVSSTRLALSQNVLKTILVID